MTTSLWPGRFARQVDAVTGAADGLGLAIAQRQLAEGATVWFLDRDEQHVVTAARDSGPNAYTAPVDIVDERGVQGVFDRIFAQAGRLDIAINSAGIVGPNNRKLTETP